MLLKRTILFLIGFLGLWRPRATRAAAVAAVLAATGCGGEIGPPPATARALPPYTPNDARLFDDGVEARALGYSLGDTGSKDAKLLPERVGAADGVVRARVVTITSKTEDSGEGLQLSLRALETITGRQPPVGEFVVYAPARSSAVGLLKAIEGRLVGSTFVVFVRGFAAEGSDDGALHFHLAPDDQDEQDRIRAASLGPAR
jgi:hypothetical protein